MLSGMHQELFRRQGKGGIFRNRFFLNGLGDPKCKGIGKETFLDHGSGRCCVYDVGSPELAVRNLQVMFWSILDIPEIIPGQQLTFLEHLLHVLGVGQGEETISPFRVHSRVPCKCIRLSSKLSRSVENLKVKGGKELGPPDLSPAQQLSGIEVFQVLMVCNHPDCVWHLPGSISTAGMLHKLPGVPCHIFRSSIPLEPSSWNRRQWDRCHYQLDRPGK